MKKSSKLRKTFFEAKAILARAINTTAEHPYLVVLDSKEECDKYSGNVWNRESDEFDGVESEEASLPGTCTRWVEVKDLKESMYIVAPITKSTKDHFAGFSTFFSPTMVKPTNLCDFSKYLATIPEPISMLKAGCGLPKDMYNTSASLSYSQAICSGFSTINLSIVSASVLNQTNSKQSKQSHPRLMILYKLQQDIYSLLQESCENHLENKETNKENKKSLNQEETVHPESEFNINNYLNVSFYSNNDATVAQPGRAAVSKTVVHPDVRVQIQNLDESPGGGVFFLKAYINLFVGNSDIFFDKIASIEAVGYQHVYDLSIEGTRNFIANDIVAHNTYLATSSGNVGIGTTAPLNPLHVIGASTFAGGVNASSLNVTGFSITDDSLVTVVEFDEEENKEVKPLNLAELSPTGIRTDFTESIEHNNYLKFSILDGRKSATDAQFGRAAVSKTVALTGIWVQTQSNLNENPGGGAPTIAGNSNFKIKKLKIKDIKAGQYVLSLDEITGKLVPRKVNALLDHGIKPIYEMKTEDGRAINTTAEHPYLVVLDSKEECDKYSGNVWNRESDEFDGVESEEASLPGTCTRWVEVKDLDIAQSTVSNPHSQTINNLPLNSLTSAKREDSADVNFSTVGGWIKNTTIPQNFFGGNIALFRKSVSLESKTKDFSLASKVNLPFLVPLAAYSAENPLDSRNSLISILMFSSSRNFGESDITFSADGLGGIFQGVPDHFLGEARITPDNTFYAFPGSNQFNNITNQNSSAFESRLSMADFTVRNNVFANFDPHKTYNDGEIFKGFEIAVPDYSTGTIIWEKISSIKVVGYQHVYDLSIEGTRNFIANDIVAHNTYLATSSGNVGINTTTPANTLTVQGTLNVTSQPTRSGDLFVASSGNVGIGTTSPSSVLQVAGTFNATSSSTQMLLDSNGDVTINLKG